MDKATRNAIERATQRARRLLTDDLGEQLEGTYDVLRSGHLPAEPGGHLNARQRLDRARIVASIEHKRAAGLGPADAVADYLRDAAFTAVNRFVALKMLEARELVQECVSRGEQSAGYREFYGLAAGVPLLPDGAGYRLYLESLCDELSTEVKVLFDRRDAASVLWPRRRAETELLGILNDRELAGVWLEDETIGWVYQFFNSGEERRAMREQSQAPRNSRELAVRNQFFTPRYVVQFLVDNTLGRLWYEMRQGRTVVAEICEFMVRRPRELFLHRTYTWDDKPPKWLTSVWAGDFTELPETLDYASFVRLALSLDGWEQAERLGLNCVAIHEARYADYLRTGRWRGDVAELWLCLFYEQRACRFASEIPEGEHWRAIVALYEELRRQVRDPDTDEGRASVTLVPERLLKDPRDLRVLDPACGSGHFLLYAFDVLSAIYEEAWQGSMPSSESTGRTLHEDYPELTDLRRAVPTLILEQNLHGIDIDPRCAQIAQLALWMRAQRSFKDAGLSRAERPRVARTGIVVAEPIPADAALLDAFVASLDPPLLGGLVRAIVGQLSLAGELGFLLKVDETLRALVAEARAAYDRLRQQPQWLPGFEPPHSSGPRQDQFDFTGLADERFLLEAEARIRQALAGFIVEAAAGQRERRRLFAEDTANGVRFLELVRQRYDVILMNPPFGACGAGSKNAFEAAYPRSKCDLYAAFVERGIELLHPQGQLGAITSRTGFFLSTFQRWREEILLKEARPSVFADLGYGVLDSAMVEVAAYCLEKA